MHDEDDLPHLHIESSADHDDYEDVEGLEKHTLTSVGIDIGSSTSHVVFSRLTLRRRGADLSTRFEVTERSVLYRSPIMLTPYLSSTTIDTERLATFISGAYEAAGLTAEEIDTGVVIITGEALNKENAQPIAELFAHQSGKFICVSAGPNHEALLAAYGSGAVGLSTEHDATVLCVDVGGGTTKLAVIRHGVVTDTAAISIGARLMAFDEASRINRVEQPLLRMAESLSMPVELGQDASAHLARGFVELMVDVLFDVLLDRPASLLTQDLWVTEPLQNYHGLGGIDYIVFSGGVSEYVYGREKAGYGDLGQQLGAAIKGRLAATTPLPRLGVPAEGIRATVIGASEYTIQASGVTSYISTPAVLPTFGLKVLKAQIVNGSVAAGLAAALKKFDLARLTDGIALALALDETPNYQILRCVAEDIVHIARDSDAPNAPLFVMIDADVAKALGAIMKDELLLAQPIVVIDGIDVGDLDYVDIGRPMGVSGPLPVTVKSLTFPTFR